MRVVGRGAARAAGSTGSERGGAGARGGRSGWGNGRTISIALRGRARPSLIGCHQASGRATGGVASGRALSALGSAGGLARGEKGHVFIAGVDLERIGRRLLRLLVGVDQGVLSDRLGVAEEGGHWVVPLEPWAASADTTADLEELQGDALGFAKGLGSLGEDMLG